MATPTTIHVQLFLSGSPGPSTKITLPAPTAATSSDGLTVDALRTLLTTTSENFATHFNDVPASHLRVFANREDAAKASESLKDVREQELAQKGPDDVDENAVVEMEPQGPLEKIIAEGNGKIYCCFMREDQSPTAEPVRRRRASSIKKLREKSSELLQTGVTDLVAAIRRTDLRLGRLHVGSSGKVGVE